MPLTGKIRVTKGLDSSHKVLDHACKSKNPFERIDVGEFDSWKNSQPTKLEKDLKIAYILSLSQPFYWIEIYVVKMKKQFKNECNPYL